MKEAVKLFINPDFLSSIDPDDSYFRRLNPYGHIMNTFS